MAPRGPFFPLCFKLYFVQTNHEFRLKFLFFLLKKNNFSTILFFFGINEKWSANKSAHFIQKRQKMTKEENLIFDRVRCFDARRPKISNPSKLFALSSADRNPFLNERQFLDVECIGWRANENIDDHKNDACLLYLAKRICSNAGLCISGHKSFVRKFDSLGYMEQAAGFEALTLSTIAEIAAS